MYKAVGHIKISQIGIINLLMMLLMASCSPQRKLARQYVTHHKGMGILIVPLYELYKDNLTISYNDTVKFSPADFDSIAWFQSVYIQHVSDSIFLTRFTNSLINELDRQGFDVYVGDSSDAFVSFAHPRWLVQIAQLQLNEKHIVNTYEVYSENMEGIETDVASLRMNMVSLSSWVEARPADTGNMEELFLEASIMDDVKCGDEFRLNEGDYGLQHNRDSIEMDDVYKLADKSGRKYAGLLFNHFMNDYICTNLPAGIINRKYFYYNPKSNSLKSGLTE